MKKLYIDPDFFERPEEPGESIEERMVELLMEMYEPAETMAGSDEQKTTVDLIEEMETSSDVMMAKVVMAMEDRGFKLKYTGVSYVWLLRERRKNNG